jgi:glycosyltransferase involved in cell wall biosynthesis
MHILLIHQAFVALDEPGGTRHHEMATFLAERGHRVTIIASPISYLTGNSDAEIPPCEQSGPGGRVTILRAFTYRALHRSFVHRIISFLSFMISSFLTGLRVRDVDLVWGTSPPIFQGMTAWALARLKRCVLLFEVRDLWPAFAIQVGVLQNRILIRLSEWLERFLYSHADQVLVNSPGFVEHVKTRGGGEVALVPNGADTGMFDPSAQGDSYRDAHGLTGKFVALYAGAHGMSNDLGVVLEAASRLSMRPELALVLLGDGKDKPELMARSQEMGLENVFFLPPVPKSEMGAALAAADACIAILKPIPMYGTVYPNKVFDYMAAGRPVILAIDGVIRKVVEDANAGVFVPPGDSDELARTIALLADDPAACKDMGMNGRRCVEAQFDRAILAEELAELMESLAQG